MLYGIIHTLHRDRGFGFIRQEGGRDVFFAADAVVDNGFMRLQVQQPVKFELVKRTPEQREEERKLKEKKGPRAALVQPIERMPGGLLPKPPQEMAPRHHPCARQRKPRWKRRIDVQAKRSDSG